MLRPGPREEVAIPDGPDETLDAGDLLELRGDALGVVRPDQDPARDGLPVRPDFHELLDGGVGLEAADEVRSDGRLKAVEFREVAEVSTNGDVVASEDRFGVRHVRLAFRAADGLFHVAGRHLQEDDAFSIQFSWHVFTPRGTRGFDRT